MRTFRTADHPLSDTEIEEHYGDLIEQFLTNLTPALMAEIAEHGQMKAKGRRIPTKRKDRGVDYRIVKAF